MKRLIPLLLCLAFLTSCGGSAHSRRADELEAKNTALTARVKNLEEQLLAAEKKLITHEQALQTIGTRQREMESRGGDGKGRKTFGSAEHSDLPLLGCGSPVACDRRRAGRDPNGPHRPIRSPGMLRPNGTPAATVRVP